MNRRRWMLLSVILVLGLSLASATAGFSATAAERSVTVDIADDQTAFLGFEQTTNATANETTELEITVRNQFAPGIALSEVSVTIGNSSVSLLDDGPLYPGEETSQTFSAVSCDATLSVEASGSGVSVQLERSVDCP
ncbi:hypothetical protein RH858_12780 [Halalkaliarchaeum sp. AArc-GB]|uniref:hypothetical protein n=1 Tax=Halalkaliarchaeum sp. AArc-GB TaxID=3074078 RepID=UPI00285C6441|nr:hypothetical protein [Halalkaliarchaeum sp. AArc-GB]MDR5674019.1 hypothetical protein [Halalkaliarchaeum sp. AArc-GB]